MVRRTRDVCIAVFRFRDHVPTFNSPVFLVTTYASIAGETILTQLKFLSLVSDLGVNQWGQITIIGAEAGKWS